MVDWLSVFDEARPDPGASDGDIERFVATVGKPPTAAEVRAVHRSQSNPFPKGDPLHAAYRPFDPSAWVMPSRALPPLYLAFLRWSNGGWFRSGERELGFFPSSGPSGGVRAMMLAYHLPEYMPSALPFAFNGGGTFYLFDMREEAIRGEHPVVCAHAGNLGWGPDECCLVAGSFVEACRGKVNVDHLR
jgi:hypothetical protein